MTTPAITTTDEIYAFIAQLKIEAEKRMDTDLVIELDSALHLGSSGLEVLGAIRKTLIENQSKMESFLNSIELNKLTQIIIFIDKAFGRI